MEFQNLVRRTQTWGWECRTLTLAWPGTPCQRNPFRAFLLHVTIRSTLPCSLGDPHMCRLDVLKLQLSLAILHSLAPSSLEWGRWGRGCRVVRCTSWVRVPPKFPVALPQSQVRHLRSRCGTSLPSPAPHPAEPQAPGATLPVNVAVLKWRLGAGCQLWLYYREENNFQLNARRDGSIKVLATSSNEGTPTGRSLGRAFCCGLSSSGSDLDL